MTSSHGSTEAGQSDHVNIDTPSCRRGTHMNKKLAGGKVCAGGSNLLDFVLSNSIYIVNYLGASRFLTT